MTAGLTAGAVAAIAAVLISLPLRSPSDTLLNSASVALAALLWGVVGGGLWAALRSRPARAAWFLAAWTVIFLTVTGAVILYGRSQLDHFTAFALPLALVIYLVTGLLTVAISRYFPGLRWWHAAGTVAVALAVGFGLVTQGDQESGRLELPPPGSRNFDSAGPEIAAVPQGLRQDLDAHYWTPTTGKARRQ